MIAIDTNVLVYFFDQTDHFKQTQAIDLLNQLRVPPQKCLIPWQVLGELLNCFQKWVRAGRITESIIQGHINNLCSVFPVASPSLRSIDHYFHIRSRFHLSHWDSLLIAACLEAGVTTLYTEDMQAGANYDGVQIINPFVGQPLG